MSEYDKLKKSKDEIIERQLREENAYLKGVGSAESWKVEAEKLIDKIAELYTENAEMREALGVIEEFTNDTAARFIADAVLAKLEAKK